MMTETELREIEERLNAFHEKGYSGDLSALAAADRAGAAQADIRALIAEVRRLREVSTWQDAPDASGWWWFNGLVKIAQHKDPELVILKVTYRDSDHYDEPVLVARYDGSTLYTTGSRNAFYGKWQRVRKPDTAEELHGGNDGGTQSAPDSSNAT